MHAGYVLTKQIILKMEPTMLYCSPLTWKTARAILTLALLKKANNNNNKNNCSSLTSNQHQITEICIGLAEFTLFLMTEIYSMQTNFASKKPCGPFNVQRRKK